LRCVVIGNTSRSRDILGAAAVEELEFRFDAGNLPADFIWTHFTDLVAVSDRVVALLSHRELKGWRTYPVKVFGKDGAEIGGYSGLAIAGRCGPIDLSRSPRVQLSARVPGGRMPWRRKGLFFEPATWDGSDLFLPSGSGWILVTRRLKEAFEAEKIANVRFEPTNELLLDEPGPSR
jgi:hypothetical protein